MKAPSIFVVLKTTGDGYGHNSTTYVSWHWDEQEANAAAEAGKQEGAWWMSVEEVEPPQKMVKEKRW